MTEATLETIRLFILNAVEPFTLKEMCGALDLQDLSVKDKEAIISYLCAMDVLVYDGGIFYPRPSFLKHIRVRVEPTPFEIKNQVFIPGHRLLALHPTKSLNLDALTFFYNNTPLPTKIMTFLWAEIVSYFYLADIGKMPIINMEEIIDNSSVLKIKVIDMKSFYSQVGREPALSFILHSLDFNKGHFAITGETHEVFQQNIFRMERMDRKFIKTLLEVIQKELIYPNVEKQLMYTYFYMRDMDWEIPGSTIDSLLVKNPGISANQFNDGRCFLFYTPPNTEEKDSTPTFTDYMRDNLDNKKKKKPDLTSIKGILQFLGNNNTLTTVHAFLLDMITNEEPYVYEKVEKYIFVARPKPYLPPQLEEVFKKLMQDEYRQLHEWFDPVYAFLPITTARQKILDAFMEITIFLRRLDEAKINPNTLPGDDVLKLLELDKALTDFLLHLENSQKEKRNESREVQRILKIVDRLNEELPIFFRKLAEQLNF